MLLKRNADALLFYILKSRITNHFTNLTFTFIDDKEESLTE